jgi:DNA-binding NarL/FixJ family response regulator
MKIMIVDDHSDMRRILGNIVLLALKESVELIECESGEQAVEQYAIHHPDYVLMDVELTKMNGFEATEQIYIQDKNARIIIMTAHNSPSVKYRAEQLRVRSFILKENLSELNQFLQNLKH